MVAQSSEDSCVFCVKNFLFLGFVSILDTDWNYFQISKFYFCIENNFCKIELLKNLLKKLELILITFYSTTRFKVYNYFKVYNCYFQHTYFTCSFNTHFGVQFQHTHFRCSFNTHISGAVSTHKFQVQFQHTHFSCSFNHSFNTHISTKIVHLK